MKLVIFALVILIGGAYSWGSSSYMGGTVSYKSYFNNLRMINVTYRMAFERSHVYCDKLSVSSGRQIVWSSYAMPWEIEIKNRWNTRVVSIPNSGNVRCADFSAADSWSEVFGSFSFNASQSVQWRLKTYNYAHWVKNISRVTSGYGSMLLEATMDNKTDFMSSPVSNIPLTVYFAQENRSVIYIPVYDPNGDVVRCRYATYQECFRGACTHFPYGVIDEGSCSLSYNGNGVPGLYPIVLKLEDFPARTTQFNSSTRLGSVDLQFTVHIKPSRDLVRLQGGNSSFGLLQVYHNVEWGTVCNDGWSIENAHVVCRQLGFPGAVFYTSSSGLGRTGKIWLDEVSCNGHERYIQECSHNGWGKHDCGHSEDIVLQCVKKGIDCSYDTCRNGGTCRDNRYYGYNCTCPNGYTGRQCEQRISNCYNKPCRNGGTCRDMYYGYRCTCPYGYTGRQCEGNLKTSVECREDYMQIDLKNVYYANIDWRALHLKDPSCKASRGRHTTSLRTSLDDCGTTHTEHGNTIVFWNEVRTNYRWSDGSQNQSSISRDKMTSIVFYCEYDRGRFVSTTFKDNQRTVVAYEGSYGNFTFTMDLYKSSRYRTPYGPFDYPVTVSTDQPLYVQCQVTNTTADLVVFIETCVATTTSSPNTSPRHMLLENGCTRDLTMRYLYNSNLRSQRFSIRSFRFVYTNSFTVYLHCKLMVCHRNSTNSRCSRGCMSSRRRRESLDGSNLYDLSTGPLRGEAAGSNSKKQDSQPPQALLVGGLAAAGGVFFLVSLLLSVLVYRYRRRGQGSKDSGAIAMEVTVNSYEQPYVDNDEKSLPM